jgi:hypothetical protein
VHWILSATTLEWNKCLGLQCYLFLSAYKLLFLSHLLEKFRPDIIKFNVQILLLDIHKNLLAVFRVPKFGTDLAQTPVPTSFLTGYSREWFIMLYLPVPPFL